MAFGLAVYASQGRSPDTTQDSLPVAGQALLDGLFTRMVPMKGFRVVDYISSSSPKLAWRKGRDMGRFHDAQWSTVRSDEMVDLSRKTLFVRRDACCD